MPGSRDTEKVAASTQPAPARDVLVDMTSASEAVTPFELPTRLSVGAPLSERHPWLYPIAVKYHQTRRWIRWQAGKEQWAHDRSTEPLEFRVKQHKSLLLRQLGESEMWLRSSTNRPMSRSSIWTPERARHDSRAIT